MKRLRIFGLALLALCALGALTASLASATEGILNPAAFKFTGGKAKLVNLNNEKVECETNSGEGTFLAGSDSHATGTIDFTKCKALGFATNTLGDPAETILAPVLFLICLAAKETTLRWRILIQPTETVHLEVPALKALILVKGATIGDFLTKLAGAPLESEPKLKTAAVNFAEKDEPTRTNCFLEGNEFKASYEAALDTKADVDAFQTEGSADVTFAEEVVFMDK